MMFAACMLGTMRPCVLGVEFTKGSQSPGAPTGALALYINDQQVGTLEDAMIQNGRFALCGEGLNIGPDGGAPITDDYPGERPWAIAGATISRVVFDVSEEPYLDLEMEALAMRFEPRHERKTWLRHKRRLR